MDSNFLNKHVALFDLAKTRRAISGKVELAQLPRISEEIEPEQRPMAYAFKFWQEERNSFVKVTLNGAIRLVCHRCMETFDFPIETDQIFNIVSSIPPQEKEKNDCLIARQDISLSDIIEDELIIMLPDHPKHSDGENCLAENTLGDVFESTDTRRSLQGLGKLYNKD